MTFDIDDRMDRWKQAGLTPEDTQSILKGGSPKGNFMGRSDILRIRQSILDQARPLYPESLSDDELFRILLDEGLFRWDTGDKPAVLRMSTDDELATTALENKDYIEKRTDWDNKNRAWDFYSRRGTLTPMNQIGALKPRVVQTASFDPPYDESPLATEDITEDMGRGPQGLARLAKERVG